MKIGRFFRLRERSRERSLRVPKGRECRGNEGDRLRSALYII
ncbi:hypothetical protein [Scytonema sp. PCC 10023]